MFVLFFLPLIAALGIAVAGMPPRHSLKVLAAVIPLQAFGAVEAGFTITPGYLVLSAILIGVLARGDVFVLESSSSKRAAIFLGIAVAATIIAVGSSSLPQTVLSEKMQYRAGPWRSPIQLALLLFHFSLFFVVTRYIRDRSVADGLLKVHLTIALVLSVVGIYQVFAFTFGWPLADCTWSVKVSPGTAVVNYSAIRYYSARVAEFSTRATFSESRDFAEYLLSAVPILLALAVSRSREIRQRFGFLASPAAAMIGLAAIFLTLSRSGWVFMALALVVIAVRLSPRLLLVHVPIAAGALSLFCLLLAKAGFFSPAASSLWDVLGGRLDWYYILNDPRVNYYLVLWESFKSHPLLGLGAGNFAFWGAGYTGSDLLHSAHGFTWAALADFGVIGFAALAALFFGVFRKLHRAIKSSVRLSPRHVILAGIFAALLATLFDAMTAGDRPQFHLIFLLGLAAAYPSIDQSSTRSAPDPSFPPEALTGGPPGRAGIPS